MAHATARQMARAYKVIGQRYSAEEIYAMSREDYKGALRLIIEELYPGRTA